MPEETARRIAERLIQDNCHEPTFEVDFLDPEFTERVIDIFRSLGCSVERIGMKTTLRVTCSGATI